MNQDIVFKRSVSRLIWGGFFVFLAIVIWIPAGDVVDMIIRQKEIVFGRYSRGHFAALLILSLLLASAAALCFSKIKTVTEMVAVSAMVIFSTGLSGFILIVVSGWVAKPRYIEKVITKEENGVHVKGLVRHRPPNEFFNLTNVDKPEQQRSYPNAPPGYPAFDLALTSDQYGFRNKTSLDHYPILAVGDSYVAGSHVSDEQAWVSLLEKQLGQPIYNLGVSGSDPGTYLNNFYLLGRKFKPKLVLFMIYEGNDFKDVTPIVFSEIDQAVEKKQADSQKIKLHKKSFKEKISYWADASPVTGGLRRLSSEVLEAIGKDSPVPAYQELVGWMPLKVTAAGKVSHYGFEPKRLTYLYEEKEVFRNSANWQNVSHIMQRMVKLGEQDGFVVLFVYAPSTPHVVMPLMKDEIPAQQLRNFVAYQKNNLPDAETFKHNVFSWMDNEEQVFLETCKEKNWHCVSLTKPLQEATAQGRQVYYSYDQHWTPDGNFVVEQALRKEIELLNPGYGKGK